MSNRSAFVTMIGLSELGQDLINASDGGFNVLVGSTAQYPIIFRSYATHPNVYNKRFNSTAAGIGQIIYPTFVGLCKKYGYTDFGKATQYKMILNLIDGRNALDDVDSGRFAEAIKKCCNEWASFPGGSSGQNQHNLATLQKYYTDAGGQILEAANDSSNS